MGSFSKLYENLGFPHDRSVVLPLLDPESELSNSDDALLPSPLFEPAKPAQNTGSTAEDQPLIASGLNKKQRQKARKRAEKERQELIAKEAAEQRASLRNQLEAEGFLKPATKDKEPPETPTKPSRAQSRSNVSAKIRAASPGPAPTAGKVPTVASQQHQDVKTLGAPRPVVVNRSSTTQSATAQPAKTDKPLIVQPAEKHPQFTTPSKPPAFQQPHAQVSVAQPQTPQLAPSIGQGQGLVPRTVRPLTLPRRSQPAVVQVPATPTPTVLPPSRHASPTKHVSTLTIRSQVDRHFHLFNSLLNKFPDDRKWLISPMQLINEKTTSHGLHVFVDASNIMIGFKDMLRNHGIAPFQYDMSFDSLALLMERRRPVAKRVFAGSHREANPLPQITKLVDTSKAVGYDSVMQEQVLIVREDSEKKKFFNDVKKHGWFKATQLRSGSGSDSETSPPAPKTPSAPKWVEQGVDEILHLKMCQSILDVEEPSTMVLATGDGAVAEMSDGFLAHVERALRKGWKVELISWGQQTNGGYKNKKFRAKWGEQFQIIELDDFLEDLIDTP